MPKQAQRSNFTDAQKAEIYSRDRATCVYTCKSLWLLDYGACPLFQWDWADHVKPSARHGKAVVLNGVCASHTYNQKKKANGADNYILLDGNKGGAPSENYFDYYGAIPPVLEKQLHRLAAIKPSDWYFNRAVGYLLTACDAVYRKTNHQRTPAYYHRAAQTKLGKFFAERAKDKVASFEERKLIIHPEQKDVQLLLSLSIEHTEKHFHQCIKQLEIIYAKNALAMERFWEQEDCISMKRQYNRAARDPAITPVVLSTLQSHLHFWENDPRA